MANVLGNYNETFFAQEALIQLTKALGMASRVYRDYDQDLKPQAKGDTIQIRRPGTFTVNDAPATAQDLSPDSVALQLAFWKEVKFGLNDKELSITNDRILEDHITPAAYAIADYIDQQLAGLYHAFPWQTIASSTVALADLTAARKVAFDNKVPLRDKANMHVQVDSTMEAGLLNALSATGMLQTQGETIRQGSMGVLYGMEFYANQNAPSYTGSPQGDLAGTGTGTAGNATINVAGLAITATYKKGDIFTLAGDSQPYTFGADFTTDGAGAASNVPLGTGQKLKTSPAGAALTITAGVNSAKNVSLLYHRNAIALAMAPLSQLGGELGGAKIAVAADPITGLALRARMFYDAQNSKVYVAMDVLFGYTVLDYNLGVRIRQN